MKYDTFVPILEITLLNYKSVNHWTSRTFWGYTESSANFGSFAKTKKRCTFYKTNEWIYNINIRWCLIRMEFRNRIPNSIYIIGRDIIEFSLSACIIIRAYFLNGKENLLNHLSYISSNFMKTSSSKNCFITFTMLQR